MVKTYCLSNNDNWVDGSSTLYTGPLAIPVGLVPVSLIWQLFTIYILGTKKL